MNEILISSWNELQDALFEDAWNPEIERYRSRNAFRGCPMRAILWRRP
jgi:hypothetical protein